MHDASCVISLSVMSVWCGWLREISWEVFFLPVFSEQAGVGFVSFLLEFSVPEKPSGFRLLFLRRLVGRNYVLGIDEGLLFFCETVL